MVTSIKRNHQDAKLAHTFIARCSRGDMFKLSRAKNALKVIRAYVQMAIPIVPGDIPELCSLIQQCTLQVKSEMMSLAELLRNKNVRYGMEIGTCRGGTLFLLCHFAAPDATIISMDLPG